MSAGRVCYACNQPLLVLSRGEARCSPGCPGGGRFARCGFCKQVSFAIGKAETPYCYNPECRMHGRARRRCEECRQVSRIEVAGHPVCLNRRCSRNEGQLEQCAICERDGRNEPSFMQVAGEAFCGRGACDALLIAVRECPWCNKRTLATEDRTCIWPDCGAYGLEQILCERCTGPALADPDDGRTKCKNPECKAPVIDPMAKTFAPEMTIMDLWSPAASESQVPGPRSQVDAAEELEELPAMPESAGEPSHDLEPARSEESVTVGAVTVLEITTPPPSERAAADAVAESLAGELVIDDPGEAAQPGDFTLPDPITPPAAAPEPAKAPAATRDAPDDSALGVSLGVLEDDLGDAPLAVIVGAIGSGKTTFLTTLGHMLAAREAAYHFPYSGLTVRRFDVQELLERRASKGHGRASDDVRRALEGTVRDLAHDFAQPLYDTSLALGAWPPATATEDARILVADLVRGLQPAARLVTAEVPGEAIEEALRDLAANRPHTDATASAAAWLLERGERIVLLLDPTAERTDALYEGLFRVLRDALAPRALNAVAKRVRERLEARGQRGIIDEFERAAARHDRDAARAEQAAELRGVWEQRVKGLGAGVAGADPRGALEENADVLRKLEQAWQSCFPQEYAQATAYVREREFTLEAIVTYCRGLVKNTMTAQRWSKLGPALVNADLAAGEGPVVSGGNEREIAQVTAEVLEGVIPPEVRIDLAGDLRTNRPVQRFPRLQSLSLCVTKSDAIPLVHPPREDPPRRFPRTAGPLRDVEAFLTLDGGAVNYYHTSATGYSLDTGLGRVPGPAGSCTPVNVLEPVLDGLIG